MSTLIISLVIFYDQFSGVNSQCKYVDTGLFMFPIDKCVGSYANDTTVYSYKYTCIRNKNDYSLQATIYKQFNCEGEGYTHLFQNDNITYQCDGSSDDCQFIHITSNCDETSEIYSFTLITEICNSNQLKIDCSSVTSNTFQYTSCNTTDPQSFPFTLNECDNQILQCYGEPSVNTINLSMIEIISLLAGIATFFVVISVVCCVYNQNLSNLSQKQTEKAVNIPKLSITSTSTIYTDTIERKSTNTDNDATKTSIDLLHNIANIHIPSAPPTPAPPIPGPPASADINAQSVVPLPNGWRQIYTLDGRVYYQNELTNKTHVPNVDKKNKVKLNNNARVVNDNNAVFPKQIGGKHRTLKAFFYNRVGIDGYTRKYIELMIENGIENLNVLKTLTMDDLVRIGIDKLEHRKRIMNEIEKLRCE